MHFNKIKNFDEIVIRFSEKEFYNRVWVDKMDILSFREIIDVNKSCERSGSLTFEVFTIFLEKNKEIFSTCLGHRAACNGLDSFFIGDMGVSRNLSFLSQNNFLNRFYNSDLGFELVKYFRVVDKIEFKNYTFFSKLFFYKRYNLLDLANSKFGFASKSTDYDSYTYRNSTLTNQEYTFDFLFKYTLNFLIFFFLPFFAYAILEFFFILFGICYLFSWSMPAYFFDCFFATVCRTVFTFCLGEQFLEVLGSFFYQPEPIIFFLSKRTQFCILFFCFYLLFIWFCLFLVPIFSSFFFFFGNLGYEVSEEDQSLDTMDEATFDVEEISIVPVIEADAFDEVHYTKGEDFDVFMTPITFYYYVILSLFHVFFFMILYDMFLTYYLDFGFFFLFFKNFYYFFDFFSYISIESISIFRQFSFVSFSLYYIPGFFLFILLLFEKKKSRFLEDRDFYYAAVAYINNFKFGWFFSLQVYSTKLKDLLKSGWYSFSPLYYDSENFITRTNIQVLNLVFVYLRPLIVLGSIMLFLCLNVLFLDYVFSFMSFRNFVFLVFYFFAIMKAALVAIFDYSFLIYNFWYMSFLNIEFFYSAFGFYVLGLSAISFLVHSICFNFCIYLQGVFFLFSVFYFVVISSISYLNYLVSCWFSVFYYLTPSVWSFLEFVYVVFFIRVFDLMLSLQKVLGKNGEALVFFFNFEFFFKILWYSFSLIGVFVEFFLRGVNFVIQNAYFIVYFINFLIFFFLLFKGIKVALVLNKEYLLRFWIKYRLFYITSSFLKVVKRKTFRLKRIFIQVLHKERGFYLIHNSKFDFFVDVILLKVRAGFKILVSFVGFILVKVFVVVRFIIGKVVSFLFLLFLPLKYVKRILVFCSVIMISFFYFCIPFFKKHVSSFIQFGVLQEFWFYFYNEFLVQIFQKPGEVRKLSDSVSFHRTKSVRRRVGQFSVFISFLYVKAFTLFGFINYKLLLSPKRRRFFLWVLNFPFLNSRLLLRYKATGMFRSFFYLEQFENKTKSRLFFDQKLEKGGESSFLESDVNSQNVRFFELNTNEMPVAVYVAQNWFFIFVVVFILIEVNNVRHNLMKEEVSIIKNI